MKKRDLIQAVAIHADVDKKTATAVVEGTIDVILATVASGDVVNISGFAKFWYLAKKFADVLESILKNKFHHDVLKILALKPFRNHRLNCDNFRHQNLSSKFF
jgi:nucleoid DNA-binding protein